MADEREFHDLDVAGEQPAVQSGLHNAEPIPDQGSQSMLEVHAPHAAAHSWKDFFIHIATITIGLLIAVALEQLVEQWHWGNEVKIARQAIAAEMTANNSNLFSLRIAIAPCVERQLRDANAILTALEAGSKAGSKPDKTTNISEVPGSLLRDSEWQSERASQVLTHFPRAELALMGRYYAQIDDFRRWLDMEVNIWQELRILQKPPAGITASDLIRLRVQLGLAGRVHYLVVNNARRELRISKQLGVAVADADPQEVKNYCTMNFEDYRHYRGTVGFR